MNTPFLCYKGIKATNRVQQMQDFNNVCYDRVLEQVKKGFQVRVCEGMAFLTGSTLLNTWIKSQV